MGIISVFPRMLYNVGSWEGRERWEGRGCEGRYLLNLKKKT